jgi:hypothetical protein
MTRIGVSGHRRYLHPEDVRTMTAGVLDRIIGHDAAPTVLSNLAEGADRLVAELVLTRPGARLEVVLPLAAEAYIDDFDSDVSRRRFTDLMDRATSVVVVDQLVGEARDIAYERAGHAIVDASDVLVALWDGRPARGRGGTAEIVQYALDHDVLVEMILVERAP